MSNGTVSHRTNDITQLFGSSFKFLKHRKSFIQNMFSNLYAQTVNERHSVDCKKNLTINYIR